MVQKILINTNTSDFTISRSTYTYVMHHFGWKFIGMYATRADAEGVISKLKGIDSAPVMVPITTHYSGNGSIVSETEGYPSLGLDYTYRFEPAMGHRIYSVIIDGVDCGPVSSYTFHQITHPHTLTVIFSPVVSPSTGNTTCTIFATPGGYISKKGNIQIPIDSSFTFRAQPYPGYKYDRIVFNGEDYDLSSVPQGSLLFEKTIESVTEPISIQVYFTGISARKPTSLDVG